MTITIPLSTLQKATINSPTAGPIALALTQRGLLNVWVGRYIARWTLQGPTGPRQVHAALPLAAVEFQRRLEYGDRFEILPMVRPTKEQITRAKNRLSSPLLAQGEEDHATLSLIASGQAYSAPFTFTLPEGVPVNAK